MAAFQFKHLSKGYIVEATRFSLDRPLTLPWPSWMHTLLCHSIDQNQHEPALWRLRTVPFGDFDLRDGDWVVRFEDKDYRVVLNHIFREMYRPFREGFHDTFD